jgi:hypothetical protein
MMFLKNKSGNVKYELGNDLNNDLAENGPEFSRLIEVVESRF